MEKKWLNTLEAAWLITPKCTENSARSIIHNLVRCGTLTKHYPQIAIFEGGHVQTISKKIPFFIIDEIKSYLSVKEENIKAYKAGGVKLEAQKEGNEALTFTSMLDAATILECSYQKLRYCVKKGGGTIGEYKITVL